MWILFCPSERAEQARKQNLILKHSPGKFCIILIGSKRENAQWQSDGNKSEVKFMFEETMGSDCISLQLQFYLTVRSIETDKMLIDLQMNSIPKKNKQRL